MPYKEKLKKPRLKPKKRPQYKIVNGSLKATIVLLCRNKEYVTPEEKKIVAALLKHSLPLKVAYEFCSHLTGIFNGGFSVEEAHSKINEWISSVECSQITCFNNFIQLLKKYKREVANYFQHGVWKNQEKGRSDYLRAYLSSVMDNACFEQQGLISLTKQIALLKVN